MILFDGCSYTYGHELENPEKDAFPHLVARMGLMEGAKPRTYVTLGKNGKSNDGILRTTLDFCEKNPVSIAIIQFTIFSRRELLRLGRNKYFHITAENNDEGSIEYYKHLQNVDDDVANFHKNKFILESYFKKRNIKYFFLSLQNMKKLGEYNPSSWYHLGDKEPVSNIRELLGGRTRHPEYYVTGHPNKRGHEVIAKHIHENIY